MCVRWRRILLVRRAWGGIFAFLGGVRGRRWEGEGAKGEMGGEVEGRGEYRERIGGVVVRTCGRCRERGVVGEERSMLCIL
jgi:hypothetical protein